MDKNVGKCRESIIFKRSGRIHLRQSRQPHPQTDRDSVDNITKNSYLFIFKGIKVDRQGKYGNTRFETQKNFDGKT